MDVQQFKAVMSHWASGISVITTHKDGEYFGFTANSFASVSVDPMLISMSVTKGLFSGQVIQATGAFAINILTEQQTELAKRFAGMIPNIGNRFEGLSYTIDTNGCPLFADTLGILSCRVHQVVDVGASNLVLGEVIAASLDEAQSPLLYYHRQWGRFSTEI